ncbi:MAG: hypothetical protein R3F60_17215 [bacterium]
MKVLSLACLLPATALAAPTYSVEGEDGAQKLVVQDGALAQRWSSPDWLLGVKQQADLDGDGVLDALVYTHCGGNGCGGGTFYLATIRGGKLAVTPIDSTDGEVRLKQVEGRWQLEVDEPGGQKVYVFVDGKAVLYATDRKRVLATIAEVKGTTPETTDTKPRSFQADVDLDGKPETITCAIWERWGSLLCTLPTPTGPQTLSTGCDRFGALATTTNGRRDFVCNEDGLVRFDGKAYNEPR